jgi:hypothetical protein
MTRAHRLRIAIGAVLIALADRIMPSAPSLDEATVERMHRRLMDRLALESMGDRRNGHHRNNTPASPI